MSDCGLPTTASPREVLPEFDPADEVETSGKFCRKFAMNSSPGF